MTRYNPEPKDININNSAAELRNHTLVFVSFLLYALITATSTTHEQLLRISAVKLPLLGVDLPIVQFYLVSPLLILILHFHLLLQHFLFAQQYYSFDAALKRQYPDRQDRVEFMQSLSGNLSLVHLLGGYQKTAVQFLLAAILAIYLLIFPLFDLWFLQAKFLPFHDNDYTNWHCLMVVIDCLMLLALLPKIFDANDNVLAWWLSAFSPLRWLKRFYIAGLRRFYHLCYQRSALKPSHGLWQDKSTIKAKLKKLIPQYRAVLQVKIVPLKQAIAIVSLVGFVLTISFLSVFVSTLPAFEYDGKRYNLFIDDQNNLFINDREKWLLNYLPDCEITDKDKAAKFYNLTTAFTHFCKTKPKNKQWVFLLTAQLHERIELDFYHTDYPFLARNLNLWTKIITADEHLNHELENTLNKESTLEKIAGINLGMVYRDFRYIDLMMAQLPKAELSATNFQGADLSSANLQGASLFTMRMEGANLSSANLQGAVLYNANFSGSNLNHVNLKNAELSEVDFQNTNLQGANFNAAYVEQVKFQGSDLSEAYLQGTKLVKPQLQGANLSKADLQGAYLSEVEYGNYTDPKTKKVKQTIFPTDSEKWEVPCLTDDKKLPICKKYDPADTKTLKKITEYWVNELACSDKGVAEQILMNYGNKFKTYLFPLLKKKLTDSDCPGIQNLRADWKQKLKRYVVKK